MERDTTISFAVTSEMRKALKSLVELRRSTFVQEMNELLESAVGELYVKNSQRIKRLSKLADDADVAKLVHGLKQENDAIEWVAQGWMEKQTAHLGGK